MQGSGSSRRLRRGRRASEMQTVQPLVISVDPPTESGIKVPG